MTIPATILGAQLDHHRCVLTCMDEDGNVSELVISADMAVLPDEVLLSWTSIPVEREPVEL